MSVMMPVNMRTVLVPDALVNFEPVDAERPRRRLLPAAVGVGDPVQTDIAEATTCLRRR